MSSRAPQPPIARPRGAARLILRLPVALYRIHLGWVLGQRFLLLTHRGRKTGRVHQTVIEVIAYDPERREATVISAWGERADWFRNVQAAPAISVQLGGMRCQSPAHRVLTAAECDALLLRYQRDHALGARVVGWLFRWPTPDRRDEWRALTSWLRAIVICLD